MEEAGHAGGGERTQYDPDDRVQTSGRDSVQGAGFFFSAEISEISPKTSFIGDHRYFLIPNEIFRYS
jgi:hypothetical protein